MSLCLVGRKRAAAADDTGGRRMFFGRQKELEELERRYAGNRKEFGVIYGRRRIGKSALVRHFFDGKKGLFFQAKQDTSYGNLRSFSYELNKLLHLPTSFVYANWQEAFDALLQAAGDGRFLFVIDEYPYIVSQDQAFSSILQEFVDHAPENIFTIILGSDVSFLKRELEDRKSPLYKRRTFEMRIGKLPFDEAILFLDGMSREDQCAYLSLMSSYPYYLAAVEADHSFDENVQSLLFNEFGTFFTLPDQVLSNSTKVQDVYNAILHSVAHRHYSLKEISLDIHEESSKVSKYITTLLKSEILEKRSTFMGKKNSHYYVIADPLLRFWYTFVYDRQELIRINGKAVFSSLSVQIREFLDRGFEDTVLLFLDQENRKGALPGLFPEIRNFKADKTSLGRSVEIDGLARSGDVLLVVECKYRNKALSKAVLDHLKESSSIFSEKLRREYYLFSKSGFSSDLAQADNVHCYSLEEMFG